MRTRVPICGLLNSKRWRDAFGAGERQPIRRSPITKRIAAEKLSLRDGLTGVGRFISAEESGREQPHSGRLAIFVAPVDRIIRTPIWQPSARKKPARGPAFNSEIARTLMPSRSAASADL